jgi:hypothetical protein
MAAKLTRLTHKVAIQQHLVAVSYTIYSFRYRRPVRKLLDTPSYIMSRCNFILKHRYLEDRVHSQKFLICVREVPGSSPGR